MMRLLNVRAVEFKNVENLIKHLRSNVNYFVEANKRFYAAIKDKPYYKYFLEENNDV
uniref:Uncharacterized protein n=1 Tax=Bracon brevicornis TaxID=1563983 RepID=A0A6V7HTH8_9HYME